jgi:long-chain acyl-CoA synthetase
VIARLARQLELALTTVDLSLPQYRVLTSLADGNEAASALAEKLAVSRPSVTGVVDGLVTRGLVRRVDDPADRRRVGHDLTDAGRRLLDSAETEVERRLAEILSHRPDQAPAAGAGLAPWQKALDAYRTARRAARRREAARAVQPAAAAVQPAAEAVASAAAGVQPAAEAVPSAAAELAHRATP